MIYLRNKIWNRKWNESFEETIYYKDLNSNKFRKSYGDINKI
jgi:hypothetical protein